MDAVKFVETLQRKIKNENRDEIIIRTTDDANLFVDLVEEWSKDHPLKTRQSVFLKQWPNAITNNDVIDILPCNIDQSLYDNQRCNVEDCSKCKCEFWMKEVDE